MLFKFNIAELIFFICKILPNINELGVFDSGKNIKVYLDKDKSDLLAIIYKNNIDDGSISEFIF